MIDRSNPVRMVVFDIGGVLVRIAPWAQAHAACGFGPDRLPDLDAFLPQVSRLNQAYDRGQLEPEEYVARVTALAAGRYSAEEVAMLHAAICTTEFPGLHAVFDDLEAAAVEIGVLSNTNTAHWQRLAGLAEGAKEYPLIARARHLHASFVFGCGKPDREIYEAFVAATGADAERILFFDDLERNVAGARAAGWRAERIDPEGDVSSQVRASLRAHGVL